MTPIEELQKKMQEFDINYGKCLGKLELIEIELKQAKEGIKKWKKLSKE